MRLALFSDIHGNPIALESVLEDIGSRGGADGYCILGDLVAIGYDPGGVLERLATLPNSHFVQGNTDRYVVTGHRPHPSLADAEADPRLLSRLVPVGKSAGICEGRAQTLHELMSGLQVPWTVTYAYS